MSVSITEDAIQTYINHYGRIDRRDMLDFFGIEQSNRRDPKLFINKIFKKFNFSRNYSVKFSRIKEDQAEIIRMFKEWRDGRSN